MIVLFCIILFISIILRIFRVFGFEKTIPLFAQSNFVIEVDHLSKLPKEIEIPFELSSFLEKHDPYLIAYYLDNDLFPKKTFSIVFQKNNKRTFQLEIIPKSDFSDNQQNQFETIRLKNNTEGQLQTFAYYSSCFVSKKNQTLTICPFTKKLTFQDEQKTFRFFVDSNQLTDGELIQLANEILLKEPQKSQTGK